MVAEQLSRTRPSDVVIVDVGLGNIESVRNMVQRLGASALLRGRPDDLSANDRYILPGVGSFDEGIKRLQASGWYSHLRDLPKTTPILGICLGMQLLGNGSDEGQLPGLGRIDAHFVRLADRRRIPHMGWNSLDSCNDDVLFSQDERLRFYFSHSYHAKCARAETVTAITDYEGPIVAAYRADSTRGVQFHPEKSHRYGMSLLRGWLGDT